MMHADLGNQSTKVVRDLLRIEGGYHHRCEHEDRNAVCGLAKEQIGERLNSIPKAEKISRRDCGIF